MRTDKQRANDERLRTKLKAPDPSDDRVATGVLSFGTQLAVMAGAATIVSVLDTLIEHRRK